MPEKQLTDYKPRWLTSGGLFPESVPLDEVMVRVQETPRTANERNGPNRTIQNPVNGDRRIP